MLGLIPLEKHSLLTLLVRSFSLDISLVLFFGVSVGLDFDFFFFKTELDG